MAEGVDLMLSVSGAMIDNALRASPLAELSGADLDGANLFKAVLDGAW